MVNIIKWLTAVVALIRAIIELVQAFEVPGNGEAKRNAVLEVVGVVWDNIQDYLGEKIAWSKDKVLAFASQVIDIVVKFYNLIGFFQHGGEVGPQPGQ